MTGVHYITNEHGKRIGVQIDLRKHGGLWEDFCDFMLAESRKDETRVPWKDAKKRLHKKRAN